MDVTTTVKVYIKENVRKEEQLRFRLELSSGNGIVTWQAR